MSLWLHENALCFLWQSTEESYSYIASGSERRLSQVSVDCDRVIAHNRGGSIVEPTKTTNTACVVFGAGSLAEVPDVDGAAGR